MTCLLARAKASVNPSWLLAKDNIALCTRIVPNPKSSIVSVVDLPSAFILLIPDKNICAAEPISVSIILLNSFISIPAVSAKTAISFPPILEASDNCINNLPKAVAPA